MADRALSVLAEIPSDHVTFPWFRATFMADHDLWNQLASGRAVLDTVPKLDQYLYSYGPMIESQWECVESLLDGIAPPDRLIDYGCGQGLAGLLVNDLTGGRLFGPVDEILLIEPSALALDRGAAIYEAIVPDADVTTVCKRFDDLTDQDVSYASAGHTLHVFSNSLDVEGFDAMSLLNRMLQPGRHTILSISPDRGFNGGTPKIKVTKAALEKTTRASGGSILQSTLSEFTCTSGNRPKGVVWYCELEIA